MMTDQGSPPCIPFLLGFASSTSSLPSPLSTARNLKTGVVDEELHRLIEAPYYTAYRWHNHLLSGAAECSERDFGRSTFVHDQADPETLTGRRVCARDETS